MGDLLRDIYIARTKIDIVGYQNLSGPNSRRPRGGMDLLGTKVRFLRRVPTNFVSKALKLSFPNVSEVPSFGSRCRFLVEENRHVKFLGKLLPERTGQRHAIIHRYPG